MFGVGSFDKTIYMLERGMDAAVIRRQVISDNIANVNTPNFKRSMVTFESQLERALKSEKKPHFDNIMTDKRHIPFEDIIDYRSVKPKIHLDYDSNYNNNKNNVDIDREMVLAAKNAMRYALMAQQVKFEFSKINIVLK